MNLVKEFEMFVLYQTKYYAALSLQDDLNLNFAKLLT